MLLNKIDWVLFLRGKNTQINFYISVSLHVMLILHHFTTFCVSKLNNINHSRAQTFLPVKSCWVFFVILPHIDIIFYASMKKLQILLIYKQFVNIGI